MAKKAKKTVSKVKKQSAGKVVGHWIHVEEEIIIAGGGLIVILLVATFFI